MDAATTRVTDILTWEVSAVDKPANLRPFHQLKSEGAAPATVAAAAAPGAPAGAPAAPPPPGAKPDEGPVRKEGFPPMKSDVRQAVLDACAAGLEKMQALASAAAEAPVDENAATPPELMKLLDASTADFTALATKLAPPAGPTPEAPVAAATDGGAPAGAALAVPAATAAVTAAPTTPAELTKATESFVAQLKSADDEKFARLEKAFAAGQQKTDADMALMKAKVAASEARLAIGNASGGGNSRPSDGNNAPETKPTGIWKGDLGAEVQAERKQRQQVTRG